MLYAGLVRLWLYMYHIGIRQGKSVDSRVISIGNITVGGTGKTPMIDWFLDFCDKEDINVAILSRGYKAKRRSELQILNFESANLGNSDNYGDEPWLLYKNHPRDSFYISSNRLQAARIAAEKSDLLFLDDGMQHLKLNRDLNIVVIDATVGIGNGKFLPLGPLREPLSSLSRADIIIYSKSNLASTHVKREFQPFLPDKTLQFESDYLPVKLLSSNGAIFKVGTLQEKRCLLFSGIGNPGSFTQAVKQIGGKVVTHLVLPDHQMYDKSAIKKITQFIDKHCYDFIVCTEKDWVKLEPYKDFLPEFFYLKMKVGLKKEFESFFKNWLTSKVTNHSK